MPLNLNSCIAGVFTPGSIGASSGLPPVVRRPPSLSGAAPAVFEIVTATDVLDYFMGELLHEAAHATDSYASSGGVVAVSVTEAATATDTVSFLRVFDELVGEVAPATDAVSVHEPGVFDVDITEAATAADAVDWVATDAGWYGVLGVAGPIPPASSPPTIIYIEI